MKKLTFLFAAILCTALCGADVATIKKELKAAQKAKDHELSVQKCKELYAASTDAKDKFTAVYDQISALYAMKKDNEADALLDAELEKDIHSAEYKQSLIVAYAARNLWIPKKAQEVNKKLKHAISLAPYKTGSFMCFRLYNYMLCNFCHYTKEYQLALDTAVPILDKATHLPHKLELTSRVASTYEKIGKKDEAIKYHKLCIEYAKKLKKDTSKIEKRIEALSK